MDTAIPTMQNPIAAVAIQPRQYTGPVTMRLPITDLRRTNSIIITMIGAASTPLITALQYSALIGSMPVKFRATPSATDNAEGRRCAGSRPQSALLARR